MKLTAFFAAQVPFDAVGEAIELNAIVKSRAVFVAGHDPMQRLIDELLAGVPVEDREMPFSGAERERRRRILEDVKTLEEGNWVNGIYDPRLERAGPDALRRADDPSRRRDLPIAVAS